MVRSKLRQPEAWPDRSDTPSVGAATNEHGKLTVTPEERHAEAVRTGTATLY